MAGRRSIISRLWDKIPKWRGRKAPEKPPEPARRAAPPPPPPPRPEPPYVTESDDNERIANHLIRIFTRSQYVRYRRKGVNQNAIRRNVDRMPQHVKDIARRADSDELMNYARYPEHTDEDGNNYFWYH